MKEKAEASKEITELCADMLSYGMEILYLIIQAAVFVRVCAELTAEVFLPGISVRGLCIAPILAGSWFVRQKYKRKDRRLPGTGNEKEHRRAELTDFMGAAVSTAASVLVILSVLVQEQQKEFGWKNGMVSFLFMISMTMSVAWTLWLIREAVDEYGKRMLRRKNGYFNAENKIGWRRSFWLAASVFLWLMAAGFLDAFTAACYYWAMQVQILIPSLLGFYVIMYVGERIRAVYRRREEKEE